MQRRDFVASALASSAGFAVSQQTVTASLSPQRWDMIIVGAGTAGMMLAPALTLGHRLRETLPFGTGAA